MPLTLLAIVGGLLIVGMTPYDTFGWVLFAIGMVLTLIQVVFFGVLFKAFRSEWKKF